MKKVFYLLTVFFLCVAIALGVMFVSWLSTPLSLTEEKSVLVVEPGASLHSVSQELALQGAIKWPRLLVLLGRLRDQTNIKVGEYELVSGVGPEEFLDMLNDGDVIHYSVTLIEGKTFNEALVDLKQEESLVPTLVDKDAIADFLSQLDLPNENPEGWFFPDTYHFVKGESDADILIRAHNRLRDVLSTEWEGRASNLPYENAYEALIMASIIEKETGTPSEREQIAGVFVRRLEKNMRLQTDPTVIYGLGDKYNGNIRRSHLRQATPYNTYVIKGLPPTPIAMVGREAIYAALHPAEGEALYFVAKGDGSHHFSATLEEHNNAVQEYQVRKRVENYQSAPQN
ncbi:endolytic transglycosylase MltG [Aurantivibrio plasticivorans]